MATLQSLNSDIFVATITIIGIVLGIVPLLSFFYIGELKDIAEENRNAIKEEKLRKSKAIKDLLDSEERLHGILHSKLRKAVKKYTEYAVVASVISLLLILSVYGYFGFQNSLSVSNPNSSVGDNVVFNKIFNITVLTYAGVRGLCLCLKILKVFEKPKFFTYKN